MPTIPLDQFEGTLPSRSGLPRTVQDTPLVPNPPGNLGASQVLGNAIEGLGTSAQQATLLAQQRQVIESRKKEADDVIAANLGQQEALLQLQSMEATERQNSDYTTLKTRIETRGKEIIAAGGHGLSPRARQLYQAKIGDNLTAIHLRAVNEETKRRDEAAAMVLQQGRAQAEQGMLNATTQFEYIVARSHFEDLTQQMVDAGLARGAPAAEDVRKTIEGVEVQRAEEANRINPQGMVTHYRALMNNQEGTPGLPVPPRQHLQALYDAAQAELREAQAMEYRTDVQAEKDVKQAQERVEIELTDELHAIAVSGSPTPEAVAAVERKITAAGRATAPGTPAMISQAGHDRLLNFARTLHGAMAKGATVQDDPETEYRLERGSLTPGVAYPYPTDADIDAAVQQGKIKPETGIRIVRARAQLLEEAHPSKIPEVVQAKSRMREAVLEVIGSQDLGVTDRAKAAGKAMQMQRYLEADTLFDAIMQHAQGQAQTPQDKISVARQLAEPLKQEIITNYTKYLRAYEVKDMPKLLGGLEQVFEEQGITAAVQALAKRQQEFDAVTYATQLKNLERRQALQWLGGEPVDVKTVPDPPQETRAWYVRWWDTIKGNFSGEGSGTPVPMK